MGQLSLFEGEPSGGHSRDSSVVALVDFDNAFPHGISSEPAMNAAVNRILAHVLDLTPAVAFLEIRLYGGWLEEGVFTNRASQLQAALGSADPFPLVHPRRAGLLRGRTTLTTRLASVAPIEWRHTLVRRRGLPSVRLADQPYPHGCVHESQTCPVKQLQKFARRPTRSCPVTACSVSNVDAFRVPEQKMVDVMLVCDGLWFAAQRWAVVLISSDLDLLPAAAMMAMGRSRRISLLRSSSPFGSLYEDALRALGITIADWS